MKIRSGFVSNSSSSSFCIFGWTEEDLKRLNINIDELEERLLTKYPDIRFECAHPPWSDKIIGVGNREEDLHFADEWGGDDDEGFDNPVDEPAEAECNKLLEIAKQEGLPNPEMFEDIYYNG